MFFYPSLPGKFHELSRKSIKKSPPTKGGRSGNFRGSKNQKSGKCHELYKHTGTDKDYDAYKEALNAATNEVRKSKRNFEHKLAQNIKSDSKSFYAYVRSKQKVRDKVGLLVDNAGNIITEGFLMAEELNMHFSSVFT